MNKCKQCDAVVNPKWKKCFVCGATLTVNKPEEVTITHKQIREIDSEEFTNNKQAVKIYSNVLGGKLWVVSNENIKNKIAGDGLTVYLPHEIKHFSKINATPNEIRKIHAIKAMFLGSNIVWN